MAGDSCNNNSAVQRLPDVHGWHRGRVGLLIRQTKVVLRAHVHSCLATDAWQRNGNLKAGYISQ